MMVDRTAPSQQRRPLAIWQRRGVSLVCLALIIVAHAVVNLVWLQQDVSMHGYDMGLHIASISNGYNQIMERGLAGLAVVARGELPYNWPAAGYLPWIVLSLVFGLDVDRLCLFNLLFLALLIASTYAIGRRLWTRRAGLLAAALVGCYPIVHGESRVVGIDMPGAAMAALCVAVLLRSQRLQRTGVCVLYGLCLGAATLLRPHVHFSLAAPLALYLVLSLVGPRPGHGRLRVLVNVSLLGAAAAATSAVWWFGRLGEIFRTLTRHVEGLTAPPIPGETASSPEYYLLGSPDYLDGALVVALVAGVASLLVAQVRRQRGGGGDAWIVWAWILAGTVIYLFITAHQYRYMLSVTPALALVTAAGILALPWRRARALLVAGVLVAGGLVWLLGSFLEHGTEANGGVPVFTRLLGGRVPTSEVAKNTAREPDVSIISRYSWGPPGTDAWVRTLHEATSALKQRHPRGEPILVRIVQVGANMQSRMELDLKFQWMAQPLLSASIPQVRITRDFFLSYSERSDNGLLETPISNVHRLPSLRHCYSLRIFRPEVRPPPSDECRPVFNGALNPAAADSLRVSVFHYPRCRHFLCKADGLDPKGGVAP